MLSKNLKTALAALCKLLPSEQAQGLQAALKDDGPDALLDALYGYELVDGVPTRPLLEVPAEAKAAYAAFEADLTKWIAFED